MKSTKNLAGADGSAPTSVKSSEEKPKMRRLTQQQLEAWWPFTRLNPSLFPRAPKRGGSLDDVEDALI